MDKTLVNHQIVSMRKQVRIGKRHTLQKLFKQINLIKKKITKFEQQADNPKSISQLNKLKKKLQARQLEASELKHLNVDLVSKEALTHDVKHFHSLIEKSDKITTAERLISLVAITKTVQCVVSKFRIDNPNCEQWLPVQIELWNEKKSMNNNEKKNIKQTNSKVISNQNGKKQTETEGSSYKISETITPNKSSVKKSTKKVYTPQFTVTPMDENKVQTPKVIPTKSSVIKRINIDSITDLKQIPVDDSYQSDGDDDDESNQQSKPIKDNFFLTGNESDDDSAVDDEDEDDESEEELSNLNQTKSKPNGKSFMNLNKSKWSNRNTFNQNKIHKSESENIHPSWQARKIANEKQKIVFNNPQAKRIKFD